MPPVVLEGLHFLLLLTVAMICSAVIGFDRERKNRPAGLRTHVIVCVASALIMYIGIRMKDQFLATSPNIDPARMAAQILSGIGFLGAGTILKGKDTVHGLTTAATLWSVACIGIAIGAGYIYEGVVGTLVILLVLRVVSKLEDVLIKDRRKCDVTVVFDGSPSNLQSIERILKSNRYRIITSELLFDEQDDEGKHQSTAHLGLRSTASNLKTQLSPNEILETLEFVQSFEIS